MSLNGASIGAASVIDAKGDDGDCDDGDVESDAGGSSCHLHVEAMNLYAFIGFITVHRTTVFARLDYLYYSDMRVFMKKM